MFMKENQHPPVDIIASWQNKIHKWQLLRKAPHCLKGVSLCVRKIYTFVKNPKVRDGRMTNNIWLEIKRRNIKMILLLERIG